MGICVCTKNQNNNSELMIKDCPDPLPSKRRSMHMQSTSIDEINKSRLTNCSETEKPAISTPEMVFLENTNEYIRKFSVTT